MRSLRWDGEDAVRYNYLGVGTFVATDYLEPQVKLDYATGAGANRYAGWDRFGRIVDLLWQGYGAESSSSSAEPPGLVHLQYGYDRASNRTHRADSVAQFYEKDFDELYEYDGLHRLKKFHRGRLAEGDAVIESPTLQQGWRLDATGNWRNFTQTDAGDPGQTLDQQRTSNRVNEITQIARTVGPNWATPSYDRNGNMTVIPQPKAMTETYRAAWDAWNRLVKLEEPDGGDGWQTLAEYQYDGQTWRTLAKNYAAGVLDETRHTYFSRQWQALEERLGATPAAAPPERQFVWGLRYIDDLAIRDRDTDDSGTLDERLYAMQDGNWNVVAIGDGIGAIQERYAYDLYGVTTFLDASWSAPESTSRVDNQWLFTGRRLDHNTAFYDFRRRLYTSVLGVFLSRDPDPGRNYKGLYAAYFAMYLALDPLGTQELEVGDIRCFDDCVKKCGFSKDSAIGDILTSPCVRKCLDECKRGPKPKPPSGPPPEYDPNSPGPVKEGTKVELKIDDLFKPKAFCGFISPQAMKGCKGAITWHEDFRFACYAQQALASDVCGHLQKQIDAVKGTDKGYLYKCPDGFKCCMKKKYKGTYAATVTLMKISVGPGCAVSASFSMSLTVNGEIGVCK